MQNLSSADQLNLALGRDLTKWPAQPAMPETFYLKESDRIAIVPSGPLAAGIRKLIVVLDSSHIEHDSMTGATKARAAVKATDLSGALRLIAATCKALQSIKIQPTATAWNSDWIETKWDKLTTALCGDYFGDLTLELPIFLQSHWDTRKTPMNSTSLRLIDSFLLSKQYEEPEWQEVSRPEPELGGSFSLIFGPARYMKIMPGRKVVLHVFLLDVQRTTRHLEDVAGLKEWVNGLLAERPASSQIVLGRGARIVECGLNKRHRAYAAVDWATSSRIAVDKLQGVLNMKLPSLCRGEAHDVTFPPERLVELDFKSHYPFQPKVTSSLHWSQRPRTAEEVKAEPDNAPIVVQSCYLQDLPQDCLHLISGNLDRKTLRNLGRCSRSLASFVKSEAFFHPVLRMSDIMFAWPNTTSPRWRAAQSLTVIMDLQPMRSAAILDSYDSNVMWRCRLAWATLAFGERLFGRLARLPQMKRMSFLTSSRYNDGLDQNGHGGIWQLLSHVARQSADLEIEFPLQIYFDGNMSSDCAMGIALAPWARDIFATSASRFRLNISITGKTSAGWDKENGRSIAVRVVRKLKESVTSIFNKQHIHGIRAQQVSSVRVHAGSRFASIRYASHSEVGGHGQYSDFIHDRSRGRGMRTAVAASEYSQWFEIDPSKPDVELDSASTAWPTVTTYMVDNGFSEPRQEMRHCLVARTSIQADMAASR